MTTEKSNISKLDTSNTEDRVILLVHYTDGTASETFDCMWFGQGVTCPDFLVYGEGEEDSGPITGIIALNVIRRIETKHYKKKVR